MVDALDTALMMGFGAESERAIRWIDAHLDLSRDHYVSCEPLRTTHCTGCVFEMTV